MTERTHEAPPRPAPEPPAPETPLPSRAAVLGAGLMGAGVAQLLAQRGTRVALHDVTAAALDGGLARIEHSLERFARAGRLTEEPRTVLDRIAPAHDPDSAVRDCGLVIEAVPERMDVKHEVLARAEAAIGPEVIIGTNTSQLSITAIAARLRRPERVVGLHFFNPPPVRRLVEVIPGELTSRPVLDRAVEMARAMDCATVVARDVQGFVASRGSLAFQLECYRLYEEGVSTAEEIDSTFRLGFGHPMGPLELADYLGLDTILLAAESMHDAYGDRYLPPPILRRLVAAGRLGRKSGAGFYEYGGADGDRA